MRRATACQRVPARHLFTLSPCHLVTLSPCHLVTLSPCHPWRLRMSTVATRAPGQEGMLFHRLRWSILRNATRAMFEQSLIRPATIVVCSMVVWTFVFVVSYLGFQFVAERKVPL